MGWLKGRRYQLSSFVGRLKLTLPGPTGHPHPMQAFVANVLVLSMASFVLSSRWPWLVLGGDGVLVGVMLLAFMLALCLASMLLVLSS